MQEESILPTSTDASSSYSSFLSDSTSDGVSESVEKVLSEAVDQHLQRVSDQNAELTLSEDIDWNEVSCFLSAPDLCLAFQFNLVNFL